MNRILVALAVAFLFLAGCDRPDKSATPELAGTPENAPDFGERWQYPRERKTADGRRVIVYAPQIRSWDKFENFTAQVAVEFPDETTGARYAVIDLSGETAVDTKLRLVTVAEPKVDRVTFTGTPEAGQEERMRKGIESEPIVVPVDVFLYYLAHDVLETPPPAGFNTDPPPIFVVETPTFLLFVNGKPVTAPIGKTGLDVLLNASFPTFHDTVGKRYYLLTGDRRYSAEKLEGPWVANAELPDAFSKIPAKGDNASFARMVATPPAKGLAPRVITTFKPSEIVVLDGAPKPEEIAGTGGLAWITNTESPLFKLGDTYYFLASGRWFSTRFLLTGPWKFTMPLPEAFSKIPTDHAMATVRASVPGTIEARRSVLEAMLPTKRTLKAGAAPGIDVEYAGEPQFEAIPSTTVSRAVNSPNDVIAAGQKYYLVYQGAWYVSDSPNGPWAATGEVPPEVYQIPPSSPSYPVTQVIVQTTDDGDIESSYAAAYATSMFIGFGIGYYGTGWYYPPYYGYGGYYPYYPSYGHGSWYNPNTGGFGSRSVYYGPYGGYTYNQGYNPKTGRYSNVETAWDGNEWASAGETYNPRTGISTETDRHYGEDSNQMKMDRTIEGPGGGSMDVKKRTDFDTGTRTTERTTSRGGSSDVTRQRQPGGGVTTSGKFETAGGRTGTISGEHERGQGTTTIAGSGGNSATIDRERTQGGNVKREGSFTGQGGQTVDTETIRDGRSSITKAEGSGGGSAISVKDGPGDRTTIGQSGSGDIYAGHDGNVYKKTENGWQQYSDGGWQDMPNSDRPDRPEGGLGDQGNLGDRAGGDFSREGFDAASRDAARSAGAGQYGNRVQDVGTTGGQYQNLGADRGGAGGSSISGSASVSMGAGAGGARPTQDVGSLNRDYQDRRGGYNSYQQRSSTRSSGMSRGMGARPRRR